MVIPENLHPLPVSDDEIGLCRKVGAGGFVEESKVRQLLVGPLTLDRHPTCYHGHDGSFAGRVEFHDSPFMRIAAEEERDTGASSVEAPDQEDTPLESRHRAAPPRPREIDSVGPLAKRNWLVLLVVLVIGGLVGLGLQVLAPLKVGASDAAAPAPVAAPPATEPSMVSTGPDAP